MTVADDDPRLKEEELFFQAVRRGDEGEVARLLAQAKQAGHNLSAIMEAGHQSLLMVAVRQGHVPIVKLLLNEGMDVNERNDAGKTALHLAVCAGHLGMVSCLFESGADWSLKDSQDRTPLTSAVLRNNVAMATLLLKLGEEQEPIIDDVDEFNIAALGYAVREGYAEVCEALVMEGGAYYRRDAWLDGKLSFPEIAEAEGHRECSELFREWTRRVEELAAAVMEGAEVEQVEALLARAPRTVIECELSGGTLLSMAAGTAKVDVARMLLQRMCKDDSDNIRVNARAAVLEAVLAGQVEMLSMLLEEAGHLVDLHGFFLWKRGTDEGDYEPMPLLGHAAAHGRTEVVRWLLREKRVDIDALSDGKGCSPLWLAAHRGHSETFKVLLQTGADTTLLSRPCDPFGPVIDDDEIIAAIKAVEEQVRQLSEACSSGRVEEVATMLTSQPQLVNGRRADQRRQTVLMMAAAAGQGEVVRLLLEKGARAGLVDNIDQTALMLASDKGHAEVVAMLLEGAQLEDVDRMSHRSHGAIFRACEAGHVDVVRLLLEKGATVEIPRHTRVYHRELHVPETSSVLVIACRGGSLSMVELLLEREWSSEAFGESLIEASQSLQPNLVTALLRHRRSVRPACFQSALHTAVAQGHMPTLVALVSNVMSFEETREACLSKAISTAFNHGNVGMLDAVLRMGGTLDPYLLLTPPDFPEVDQLGHETQRVLLHRQSFMDAAREGDVHTASRLIEEHGREAMIYPRIGHRSAVDVAIMFGQEAFLRWLVDNGAWLEGANRRWVANADAPPACQVGADDDDAYDSDSSSSSSDDSSGSDDTSYNSAGRVIFNVDHRSAKLGLACQHGHLGIVKYLIEKGADPTGWKHAGLPLRAAAWAGHLHVVKHLLQVCGKTWEFNPHIALRRAQTAASRRRRVEVLHELLSVSRGLGVTDIAPTTKKDPKCALLLLRARTEREYVLAKACCIHAAATVVPPCLAARAAEGLVPLPSVELAVPAQAEGGGQGGEVKKRGREEESWSMEVVCEVARFVVEGLKDDLHVELMEMLMPDLAEATRLVEGRHARNLHGNLGGSESSDDDEEEDLFDGMLHHQDFNFSEDEYDDDDDDHLDPLLGAGLLGGYAMFD